MGAALSPLVAPDGSLLRRRLRIACGVLVETVLFSLLTVLSPVLVGLAAIVDCTLWLRRRKPWMTVRIIALLWWFLLGELRGLVGLLRVWLLAGGPWARDTETRRRRTYRLQVSWAAGHLAGIRRACRLDFDVAGDELVGRGPVIVLSRHTSIVDNALPAALVSRPHGLDLRYVLKDSLQNLPTLDIGARWVPTCFVTRASNDPARQIQQLRRLATRLDGERDGVLIFPEGTRFTKRKLAAAKAAARDAEHAAQLIGFRHLLPPQPGGPVALLEEAPHAAVVVCGHVGLDGVHSLREMWSGELMGRHVRVRFWRHERDELPSGRDALVAWLYERWQELDDWVDEQRHDVRPAGEQPAREATPC